MSAPALPRTSTAPRALHTVDEAIGVIVRDRQRYLAQIEEHLEAVSHLRLSYARAGVRIDALLEERYDRAHPAG